MKKTLAIAAMMALAGCSFDHFHRADNQQPDMSIYAANKYCGNEALAWYPKSHTFDVDPAYAAVGGSLTDRFESDTDADAKARNDYYEACMTEHGWIRNQAK